MLISSLPHTVLMLFPSDRSGYWLTWKKMGFLSTSPAPWSSESWHLQRPQGCEWQGGETHACHQQLWALSELSWPWNHKLNITVSESVTEEWTTCHHLFVRAQMAGFTVSSALIAVLQVLRICGWKWMRYLKAYLCHLCLCLPLLEFIKTEDGFCSGIQSSSAHRS